MTSLFAWCHSLLTLCFFCLFHCFTNPCDTCDTSADLVQKRILFFNSSVFEFNFLAIWCHKCHKILLSLFKSTTYLISCGVTVASQLRHKSCHSQQTTVHGGRFNVQIHLTCTFCIHCSSCCCTHCPLHILRRLLTRHHHRLVFLRQHILSCRTHTTKNDSSFFVAEQS